MDRFCRINVNKWLSIALITVRDDEMKLNLRTKIVSGYLLMLIFIVVLAFTGYYSAHKVKDELDKANLGITQVAKLIDKINYNVRAEGNSELMYLMTGQQKYIDDMLAYSKNIDTLLTNVQGISSETFKADLAKIDSISDQLAANTKSSTDAFKQGRVEEAKKISIENGALRESLEATFAALDGKIAEEEKKYEQAQNNVLQISAVILLGLTLLSSVLAILIALVISNKIVKPIKQVVVNSNKLAKGDFSMKEIVVDTKDEAYELAEAFNSMVKNVRHLLYEVLKDTDKISKTSLELASGADRASKASEQVTLAIQEVARGTSEQTQFVNSTTEAVANVNTAIEQISVGAQEQVTNITLTANMVSEMARSIQEVASSAHIVAMSAEKTREAADKGKNDVAYTIKGINTIKNKVFASANEEIKKLGEHSQEIGEIIQVIDEIAGQTNLLALNAAIEAARAGEHGKGFAVVADEVRKLAERSGKATKEIADLISIIQRLITSAMTAMDEGVNEVEQGTKLARSAGITLKEIDHAAEETYRQIQNISAAAEEISASSQEVVKAIENVSAISQQNTAASQQLASGSTQVSLDMGNLAAITEESSAATEEVSASTEEVTNSIQEMASSAKDLSDMAENLKGVLGGFTVKEIDQNCWDIMDCPEDRAEKCPAHGSDEKRCWLIEGTWCGGVEQSDVEAKRKNCVNCKAFNTMLSGN